MARFDHKTACKVFHDYCHKREIATKCIPESHEPNERRPDFEIRIDDKHVVVEIKVIEPTQEDKRSAEKQKEGEPIVFSYKPGDGLIKKLKKANGQLRPSSDQGIPGIVCVVNYSPRYLLDPYDIHAGMFGLDAVSISIPADYTQRPRSLGYKSGGRETLTKEHNTSISAVTVFRATGPDQYDARLFHNHFAKCPLPEDCASRLVDWQYRSRKREGRIGDPWIRIE